MRKKLIYLVDHFVAGIEIDIYNYKYHEKDEFAP